MRSRIAWLSLFALCLTLPGVLAMADTIYDNGPINGTTDAWTINFGFVVSDTFIVPGNGDVVNGLSFGAWLFPGDTLTSAEVSITSDEFGGTTYFDGTVNFTQSNCTTNQYGYNVCTETGNFSDTNLAGGTYWLNLQNASVPNGDPVYWDENSGPSSASENELGTVPSEAFTVMGSSAVTTCGTGGCGEPFEPSTLVLFGSGMVGLAGRAYRMRRTRR